MILADLIAPDSVLPSLEVTDKKQLLAELASRASNIAGLEERDIFDALLQRERLGSTGLGQGVAIPHARLPGINRIVGMFVRLAEPVDFEAADGENVAVVVLLLTPEGAGADHLKALARISRLLRDPSSVQKLKSLADAEALYEVLTQEDTASHAA